MRPAVKLSRVAALLRQAYGPCRPQRRRDNPLDTLIHTILLFGMGRPAFPVDTHVFRVSRRLGLLDGRPTPETAQEFLAILAWVRLWNGVDRERPIW